MNKPSQALTTSSTTLPEQVRRKYAHLKTFADIVSTDSPSLAKMAKGRGEQPVKVVLMVLFAMLNDMVNAKQKLSNEQIDQLAVDCLTDFRLLKIGDFVLFVSWVRKGRFGSLYENLSPDKLYQWLEEYREKRFEWSASNSARRHEQSKQEVKKIEAGESFVQRYYKRK